MEYSPLSEILTNSLTAFAAAEAEVNKSVLNQLLGFCESEVIDGRSVYRIKETIISYNRTVIEKDKYRREPVNLIVPTAALTPFSTFRLKETHSKMTVEEKKTADTSQNKQPLFRVAAPDQRKGDGSARIQIDMKTDAAELPEGLSRIIDILYSSINKENKTDGNKTDDGNAK
jgi:hypothetical protein